MARTPSLNPTDTIGDLKANVPSVDDDSFAFDMLSLAENLLWMHALALVNEQELPESCRASGRVACPVRLIHAVHSRSIFHAHRWCGRLVLADASRLGACFY